MGYRTIFVESGATISLKNEQLIIATSEKHSIPIEDIAVLLCESKQINLTSAAISALSQSGACVMFCDEKHIPCAAVFPYCSHSRVFEVYQKQTALTLPTKKKLWAQIVKAKIQNQAKCLSLCGKDDSANELTKISDNVLSGDSGNLEAVAAQKYFKALFGQGFYRGDGADARNAALNYGYAIFRGIMARCIAGYGFMPFLGLHHCSGLNAYNLADDFMEPLRPMVDLFVATNVDYNAAFTKTLKHSLLNLANCDVKVNNKFFTACYSTELLVQSFAAICSKAKSELALPQIIELAQHCYE